MTDLATSADTAAADDTARVESVPAATNDTGSNERESLADALSEAFDRASAPADDDETAAQKSERERDEQGRFKAKEQPAEAVTEATAEAPTEPAKPEEKPEAEVLPPVPAVPPPARMDKRFHDAFAKADPEFQKYLAEREKNFDRYVSATAEPKKFYDHMSEVYGAHREMFEGAGVDFATGVSNLLAAEAQRVKDPAAAIVEIANSAGIDLLELVERQGDVPKIDPRVAALENEINNLRSQLHGVSGHLSEQSRAAEQAREQQFAAKVVAFRDKVGSAEFDPIVEDVDFHLRRIAERPDRPSSMEAMLEQAFEAAQWSNPAAREKRLAAEKANAEAAVKAERERIEADRKKAEEARKAATKKASNAAAINVRAAPPNAVALSLNDELSLTFDRVMNGAAH